MRELLEVSFQRAFDKFNEELMKKRKEPLRPSALTAIIQLMHNRSLWPSVMAELTEKFAYKQTECVEQEEEDWMIDDDFSPPTPARRPTKLPLQNRRRGRRAKPLCVRFAPY